MYYLLVDSFFAARGTILSNNVTLRHVWLCPAFGWPYRDLPSHDQELTSLGTAPVGLMLLKSGNLGLSHLMG